MIDGTDFDFVDVGMDIDRYCLHNDVPPRARYRIRLVLEELALQILKDVMKRTPLILTIEYSQKNEETSITVEYDGEKFDPADSENSLSYELLKGSVAALSFRYNSQADHPNVIKTIIREA